MIAVPQLALDLACAENQRFTVGKVQASLLSVFQCGALHVDPVHRVGFWHRNTGLGITRASGVAAGLFRRNGVIHVGFERDSSRRAGGYPNLDLRLRNAAGTSCGFIAPLDLIDRAERSALGVAGEPVNRQSCSQGWARPGIKQMHPNGCRRLWRRHWGCAASGQRGDSNYDESLSRIHLSRFMGFC